MITNFVCKKIIYPIKSCKLSDAKIFQKKNMPNKTQWTSLVSSEKINTSI